MVLVFFGSLIALAAVALFSLWERAGPPPGSVSDINMELPEIPPESPRQSVRTAPDERIGQGPPGFQQQPDDDFFPPPPAGLTPAPGNSYDFQI